MSDCYRFIIYTHGSYLVNGHTDASIYILNHNIRDKSKSRVLNNGRVVHIFVIFLSLVV
jgi:hypothetical protein